MAPKKVRAGKTTRVKTAAVEKPIRLNDLIPARDVAGGRRTVFGIAPPALGGKRKPQK